MTERQCKTPVAFFIFNRPGKTKRVLERISDVQPPELLVVADGPREGNTMDERDCERTREIVREGVDWECDVQRNYAETNLGLHERFKTGLRWVFETTPEAIILEDDCLPDDSFFTFCDVMLEEYRDDERVMDISGTNNLGTWKDDRQDYHFSYSGSIWGWATWRRSWEKYEPEMEHWTDPEARQRFRDVIANESQADYLEYIYQQTYEELDTWDYPWGFSRQLNSSLSVVPSRNLVANIGFDETATNTVDEDAEFADVPVFSHEFPVETRDYVAVDRGYDIQLHKMRPISHRNRILRACRAAYEGFAERFT